MKSLLVTCLKLSVLIGIVLFAATKTFSQAATLKARPDTEKSRPVAIKIADLGDGDGYETYSAMLAYCLAELRQNHDTGVAIITYGPEGELSGSGKHLMNEVMDYLLGQDINAYRVNAIYGGQAAMVFETETELWLVPPGAKPPKPEKHQTDLKTFVGMVGSHYGSEVPGEVEHERPSPGEVALAAFAQILKASPDSVGYLVAYQTEESGPGAWRRIAQYDIRCLKSYGVDPDRLKIIHGGINEFSSDQFWVQPKNEPPPVKEAAPDRLGDKAEKIREFDEVGLEEPQEQELAFSVMADLLKEYPDAKVCYMIMPPSVDKDDSDDKEADNSKEVPKKVDLPKPDFQRIAESWRAKFITDLKINPNRIVILYPTGVDETFQGTMQSWIVPANAALPSPPKVEDDPPDDGPPIIKPEVEKHLHSGSVQTSSTKDPSKSYPGVVPFA